MMITYMYSTIEGSQLKPEGEISVLNITMLQLSPSAIHFLGQESAPKSRFAAVVHTQLYYFFSQRRFTGATTMQPHEMKLKLPLIVGARCQ